MTDLTHFGILGMKWGRRKASSRPSSSDHITSRGLQKKKLNELSNDELKKLTSRLQLEKQYKDLSKSEISSGQKLVNEIVTGVAKQTATNYLTKGINSGVNLVVESLLKKTAKG